MKRLHPVRRAVLLALALAPGLAVAACGEGGATEPVIVEPPVIDADTIPLRTLAAARGRRIGAAVGQGVRYTGPNAVLFRARLTREFSMLTPENEMKHDALRPSAGVFRFASADSLVALAAANGMQVRGHTLVWHSQNAGWLTSGAWSAVQAESLLVDHVSTVVAHYSGQVVAWDVVNEPFNGDGSLRSGFWLDRVGPGYIARALRTAHAADPAAQLFINDYNVEGSGAKSDSLYALAQRLLADGVPLHGVGFESHFIVGQLPNKAEIAGNIGRFAALGLKVHITELDIRVPLPATPASLAQQATGYHDVVDACLEYTACEAIVVWGVSDRESWIPTAFPGFGDALLFDAVYGKKPAFRSVYQRLRP